MKRVILGLVLIVSFTGMSCADLNKSHEADLNKSYEADSNKSYEAAEKLLGVIGMEDTLKKAMDQMLQIQLQQRPAMKPYKQVMEDFINKYMSYESLKEDMIKIYAETYTDEELTEITNFYNTPVGRKTIEKMPELMAKGAQIGAARIQQNIGELQEMIKKEAERLQEIQNQ